MLTGIYPIWFAQSTLAHADIFAAACTLWGLVYALPEQDRNPWAAALWFAAAARAKETAIAIPLALAAIDLVEGFRAQAPDAITALARSGVAGELRLPLAAWYGWHYAEDGISVWKSRISALQRAGEPRSAAVSGCVRSSHSASDRAHESVCAGDDHASPPCLLDPRRDADGRERANIAAPALRRIFLLLLVNALLFSVLGGALLTRYLLPMYPLVLLIAVTTFYRRVPFWQGLAVLSMAAFVVGLFVNPPYGFAPEDNLAYAHVIRLHQAAIAQLNKRYPGRQC